jgi:diguanylate cyclase (GGDEF)-like protein
VVEASDRVRRSRICIWLMIAISIAATSPWNGWAVLVLLALAGVNLVVLEVMLKRSDHPERWAFGTLTFLMLLFAAAIPITGGADSSSIPFVIIPAAVAPMRFRGPVVLAFGVMTAVTLLAVTFGLEPSAAAGDPRLVITTISLLVCVTLANWALVEAEMTQRDAAVLDPLTGLLNRKALDVRALEIEQQARLTGASVALVAADLDGFKNVNDSHGHDRGDVVLQSVAYEMRKTLRSFELIYRLGGEEFLVLLPGVELQEGALVAERLRKTLESSRPGGLRVTASFGVSAAAGAEVNYAKLFKAADEALYEAKEAGRNRVIAAGAPDIAPEVPAAAPELVPVG